MNDALSLEALLPELEFLGWYLYALYQTCPDEPPTNPRWRCTIRANSGPPRREIAHGAGDSPILALYDAMGAAPELEEPARQSFLELPVQPVEPGGRRALADILGRKPKAVLRRI